MKRCELDFREKFLEGLPERIEREHSLWVSTGANDITPELEGKLSKIVGRHVTLLNSGTSSILVSLMLLNIKRGDKVAISNYGYPAAINCLKFLGAEPVFIDIDKETLCIDPNELEDKIEGIKAILFIENNGYVGDHLESIKTVSMLYSVPLIEDSCASLGEQYACRYGDLATLSFGPTKLIGCGEGGAIVSDRSETDAIHKIRSDLNLRLSPVLQYILLKQLEDYDQILNNKKQIKSVYQVELCRGAGAGYVAKNPTKVESMLRRAEIEYLHKFYPYQEERENSKYIFDRFFDLPLHNKLTIKDVQKISTVVRIADK